MDQEESITKYSKFEKSCFLTRVYCVWLLPLFAKGFREDLKQSDLYRSPKAEDAKLLADLLERNWNTELRKSHPSFARATIRTFGPRVLPCFFLFLFAECFLRNVQALMLAEVIHFFANPSNEDYLFACLNAAGVVAASAFYVFLLHPSCFLGMRSATDVRVAWCTMMFRKAIRLHSSAFGKTTIGQILNLMSNDVSRLEEFMIIISYIIVAPLQTCIGMYICYLYMGPSCFVGLAILFLFIPFNSINGRIFLKIRTKVATLCDTRIRIVNEIIKGMRVIKMYAWERHFSKLISDARRNEMNKIKHATFLRALNLSISIVSSRIILFAIFITYVLQGNTLNADKVFVVMSILNTLRHTMTWLFPNSIALIYELKVACQRIQTFLMLDEINNLSIESNENQNGLQRYRKTNEPAPNDEMSVSVNKLSVTWNSIQTQPSLDNISIKLKKGELLAVIGAVGSGKSTFLMSLMNEINIASGSIDVRGRIAYASQEPWSFNASVLQNILFGKPYEPSKYRRVIDVCAMKRDIKLFPYGEKTLVGERGVSLSGGQKARITLARALYNDADIYLLDDPLSAVDSEVASHIFQKCITDYLKSKTVVLVTHQIQFIKKATKILVLKEGKQFACGTYIDLINAGIDLVSLIQKPDPGSAPATPGSVSGDPHRPMMLRQESVVSQFSLSFRKNRTISVMSSQSELLFDVDDEPRIEDEDASKGSISAKIYMQYVKAGSGTLLTIAMIISTIVSQAMFHYTDIWLSKWSNAEDSSSSHNNLTESPQLDDFRIFESTTTFDDYYTENNTSISNDTIAIKSEGMNIIMYSSLIVLQFALMVIRSGTFFAMCIAASINLHNRIFFRLMRSPISFFDNNPTGRILNRFTKDVGIVDEQLPLCAYDLNLIVTQVLGTIVVVALSQWLLIFPALAMIAVILFVRHAYLKTARNIKRFESIARSPLYNQMTITLNGLATIRAFEAQPLFIDQYYRYQNDHTATFFLCFSSSRLLGLVMDVICLAYIASVALFLMIFYEGMESGTVGLAFSMALGLTGMTQWGVRQSAEFENHMTSVERLIEYSELDSEAALESNYRFPEKWPDAGAIRFDHVYLTYPNTPEPVLKNLCFDIRGGEKIGIIGRTGAGKSSIMVALFRMTEITGRILIDGVDCSAIGLHELRRNMSIIPQEPMAFIGTLRKNLDPFDEHSDDEIWAALDECQLKRAVLDMTGKLDYVLSEGGGNLSVGQRQLICLARALLRRNPILVLDEATANVDHRTDALIQRTIRHNFSGCTVLTIAHRLNTIIDSDRVLVLDAGQVVQYDTPYNLIQNENGIFYHLVQQTGPQMASKLIATCNRNNRNI